MTESAGPVHDFQPTVKQWEFLTATEPEVMFSGAFGAGKSRVGCAKIWLMAALNPGSRYLIARRKFSDLRSTTLNTLFEYVLPEHAVIDHNKSEHRIEVACEGGGTAEIWYRGLDRPAGIGSMELTAAFVDEAIEVTEEQWTMLLGRLRRDEAEFMQLFTATNPGPPGHWLYQRFIAEGQRDKRVVHATAYDNPHLPEEYVRRLSTFTGIYRERYVLGKWVGFDGVVYPDWNPLVHVVDPYPIPDDWPRYRSIDFGTVNPFVCLWAAKNPQTDQLVIYRQHYMTGRAVDEHAPIILNASEGESYEWTVADHDPGDVMILKREGVHTLPANKDVSEGIQRTSRRFRVDPDTEEPGLVIFRDSVVEVDEDLRMAGKPWCLEMEPGAYKWREGTHGTMKDEPLKKDDHGLDALRYLVMMIDGRGHSGKPKYAKGKATDATLGMPTPRKQRKVLL